MSITAEQIECARERDEMIPRYFAMIGLVVLLDPMRAAPSAAQTPKEIYTSEVVNVATRRKVTVRYVAWRANTPSIGTRVAVVLFAGGNGALHIASDGTVSYLALNYLIRSREFFLNSGVDFVAAVDAPSDHAGGMDGAFRLSKAHADDIAMVIGDVGARSGLPVWLIGNSAGTLSTAGVAARLSGTRSDPDGIVLTSTMSQLDDKGYCGKTVFDAKLATIRRPVLVVSHQNDGCVCSPAARADEILKKLATSEKKENKIFSGGLAPVSGPCDAQAQHGFYGIEQSVARFIANWIKAVP